MNNVFGGIEAGGTKFVCAIGTDPKNILEEERFPTTTPEETLKKAITFFERGQEKHGKLSAIGIASFGPVDPRKDSPTYGYIKKTPKPHWSDTEFAPLFQKRFHLPIGFDTDVNGAALGEGRWGAAKGLETFMYITVGTGIGGGMIVNGEVLHGLMHPEMGHIRLQQDKNKDPYPGHCPFHGNCFEGLACGPAIEDRWGKPAKDIPEEHEAWDLESEYIALALNDFICTLSPEKIIIGGGIMEQTHLYPRIRSKVIKILNNYIHVPVLLGDMENYIVPPLLGDKAGIAGAFALAERALGY